MGTVNLGQVAALIQEVTTETLPEGATPTVRNAGTKANAKLVFGLPEVITTAKVEAKIKAKIEAAEAKARELIDSKLINYFKNGYIQWPGMPSPLEDTSLHFAGYSWYEVNYEGNFFRAKGRNAKAFSSTKLSMEQIKNGAYAFDADEQGDAMRNINGSVVPNASEAWLYTSGIFKTEVKDGTHAKWSWGSEQIRMHSLEFNLNGVVPVAEESRPRNLTFTIWALVKDE